MGWEENLQVLSGHWGGLGLPRSYKNKGSRTPGTQGKNWLWNGTNNYPRNSGYPVNIFSFVQMSNQCLARGKIKNGGDGRLFFARPRVPQA